MSDKHQIKALKTMTGFKANKSHHVPAKSKINISSNHQPIQSLNGKGGKKKKKRNGGKIKEGGGSILRQTANGGVQKPDLTKPSKKNVKKQVLIAKNPNSNDVFDLEGFGDQPNGSISEAKEMLSKLLSPISLEQFFEKNWEKEPLLIKRGSPKYFEKLMSIKTIDEILRNHNLEFTKNIDITSYVDGVRETHNPDLSRALPPAVWDFFSSGCSVRLLDPHTYIPSIYKVCAILQELFHSRAGANVYLTPSNSQGFAPHYDDIEAFVLQVEGKKRWRVYSPPENEVLPRVSSKNFNENEIGSPVLETVLEPGDLLYFPRGFIHQANAIGDTHSLHITLSVYQQQSIGDFLKLAVNSAIDRAIAENVSFRAGLPLNFFNEMGLVHSDKPNANDRIKLMKTMKELLASVANYADLDVAADEMAKKYQHEALPPFMSAVDKERTVYGFTKNDSHITETSKVRLVKANIIRLVYEEDTYRLYFHNDNSMTFQEKEPNFIEILDEDCSIVDCLIKTYPEYTTIDNLPHDEDNRKVEVVKDLFNLGFIMIQ